MKTKEEVIKALELCAASVTDEYYPCDECPYSDVNSYDNDVCSAVLKRDAAELLKGIYDGTSQELDSSGT